MFEATPLQCIVNLFKEHKDFNIWSVTIQLYPNLLMVLVVTFTQYLSFSGRTVSTATSATRSSLCPDVPSARTLSHQWESISLSGMSWIISYIILMINIFFAILTVFWLLLWLFHDYFKNQDCIRAMDQSWHPECFVCFGCSAQVADVDVLHRLVMLMVDGTVCWRVLFYGCSK